MNYNNPRGLIYQVHNEVHGKIKLSIKPSPEFILLFNRFMRPHLIHVDEDSNLLKRWSYDPLKGGLAYKLIAVKYLMLKISRKRYHTINKSPTNDQIKQIVREVRHGLSHNKNIYHNLIAKANELRNIKSNEKESPS